MDEVEGQLLVLPAQPPGAEQHGQGHHRAGSLVSRGGVLVVCSTCLSCTGCLPIGRTVSIK